MASHCIFCGRSGTSREHPLGDKWMKTLANQTNEQLDGFNIKYTRHVGKRLRTDRQWYGRTADYKVKCACRTCNHGWMETLDSKIHPVLEPLALGSSGTLNTLSLLTDLGAWAAKVAACAASPMLDRDHSAAFRFLKDNGFPPAGTQVWLGYTEVARPQVVVQPSQLGTHGRSLARVEGYCVTFKVHHLVFQVAYLPEPLDPRRESRQDWGKYLVQLWPMNYRVVTIPSEGTPPLDEIDLIFLPSAYVADEPWRTRA